MKNSAYHQMYQFEDGHWWFTAKKRYIHLVLTSLYGKTSNQIKILDYGCGTGGVTKNLERWGNVVGIEKNPTAVKYARKRNVKVLLVNSKKLPFKNNSFDLVTILDVLYHKNVSPDSTLEEVFRVLKPKGYVIITDCAHQNLWSDHDVQMQARQRFDKIELENMSRKNHFNLIRSSYLFLLTFPLFYLQRKIIMHFTNSSQPTLKMPSSLNLMLDFICKVEAMLFTRFSLPVGSSILLVLQKP